MATPGQVLDEALAKLATKDDLTTAIDSAKEEILAVTRAEAASTKAEILAVTRSEAASTKEDLRASIRSEVRSEVLAAKNEILEAINGGIDRLRQDLNTEFARHRIPVRLATKR